MNVRHFKRYAAPLLALLIAACSTARPETKPMEEPVTTAPPATPVAPANELRAESLFPAQDWHLTVLVKDAGTPYLVEAEEELIRDDKRWIATHNGSPYAVWYLMEDGIWRLDPMGGGIRLLYLPAALKDGIAWRQISGDVDIWFKLVKSQEPCKGWVWKSQAESCWELTQLNRDQKITFQFITGVGPVHTVVENVANPSESFEKYRGMDRPGNLTLTKRAALLAQVAPGVRMQAAINSVPLQEFDEAAARMKADSGTNSELHLDLDGDGNPEIIKGVLNTWTSHTIEFLRADGISLGKFEPRQNGEHRMQKIEINGYPRPLFLYESGVPEEPILISVLAPTTSANGLTRVEPVPGWESKLRGTYGNRVSATEDGEITVEWDMHDPARHKRTNRYRLTTSGKSGGAISVQLASSTITPQESDLTYPVTAEDVLRAAFFASWYDLDAELPRYFASTEIASAFAANEYVQKRKPESRPGVVQLGIVSRPRDANSPPIIRPTELDATGSSGFSASLSGTGWSYAVWGQVTFVTEYHGSPVIKSIQIEGGQLYSE